MSVETETSEPDNSPESWADAGDETAETEEGQQASPSSETASDEETASQEDGEQQEEPAEETADEFGEPPEFWSAERKALWNKDLPLELRQAIHEHEREGAAAVNKRMMEAAEKQKAIEAQVQQFTKERDELAAWWQQKAPELANAFQNKWAKIDLAEIAKDDPARAVQLREERDRDFALLQDAHNRHVQEVQAAQQRQVTALNEAKRTEHTKLATKLPQYFGDGKAQATYDKLGSYLAKDYGLPADRIQAIYEAPVIEIALNSMLYVEAQAALKAAGKKPGANGQPTTATQTPRRIAPGARTGQPTQGDRARQANERLRTGQALSDDDVAQLFG